MVEVKVIENQVVERHTLKYFEVANSWTEVTVHYSRKKGYHDWKSRKKKKLYVWKLTTQKSYQTKDNVKMFRPVVRQGFATMHEIRKAKAEGFPDSFGRHSIIFAALTPKVLEKLTKKHHASKWYFFDLRSRRPFDDLKAGRAKLYIKQGSFIRTLRGRKIAKIQ